MKIIPLAPSTGGILKPNQVIGREQEVEQMITILKRQSINLSALRRSGKSSLLSKLNLKLEGLDEFKSIYLEVEGISNCDSFIEKLYLKFKSEKIIEEGAIKKIDTELDRLRTDDYLTRQIKEEERIYKFKYEILRKWWKINKSY